MDERQLRFVYSVIECKGVRNAAEQLDLDPSVISRTITALEKKLGIALFQRLGRSMEPTEAAMLLHEHYQDKLLQQAQLIAHLDDLKGLRSGKMAIGVSEGLLDALFNGPIDKFCKRHPRIQIALNHGSVDEIAQRVGKSEYDIGLTYNAAPQEGVHVCARLSMPIELVTPRDHPLAVRGTVVRAEELAEVPLALVTAGYGLRRAVDVFEFSHRIQLKPVFTTNGLAGLKAFVAHGHGCTLLPRVPIRGELERGLVCAVPIEELAFNEAQAQLLVRKGRRLPPAVAEMTTLIAEYLSMQ